MASQGHLLKALGDYASFALSAVLLHGGPPDLLPASVLDGLCPRWGTVSCLGNHVVPNIPTWRVQHHLLGAQTRTCLSQVILTREEGRGGNVAATCVDMRTLPSVLSGAPTQHSKLGTLRTPSLST